MFLSLPEILVHLLDVGCLPRVETLSGDALLFGQRELSRHGVVLLDGGEKMVVPARHDAGRLLKNTLEEKGGKTISEPEKTHETLLRKSIYIFGNLCAYRHFFEKRMMTN